VVNALDGYLGNFDQSQGVYLVLDLSAYGNIAIDSSRFDLSVLQLATDLLKSPFGTNVLLSIQGEDAKAIEFAEARLRELAKAYPAIAKILGRFVKEAPEAYSNVYITAPSLARANERNIYVDPKATGPVLVPTSYLLAVGRTDFSKPLDERLTSAASTLYGFDVTRVAGEFRDVTQGLADIFTRTRYALKEIIPLDPLGWVQVIRNRLRILGQAA
jgi:hypothetical protein